MDPSPPLPLRELGRLRARSPALIAVLDRLAEIAASDVPVIVTGETGTGKELAAEALHESSPRGNGPFVVVDCAAIAKELIESELFGHVAGAFTGADATRVGAFEAAQGGTVFIDELGELPLELQPRLLRVLEKAEVKPVGTNRIVPIECRVVSATHRDLRAEIAAGRFREDLFYRLAVVELELPPLRERPEDIADLTRVFVDQMSFEPLRIEEATMKRLLEHAWPGNARELRNTIERAAALSDRVLRLPEDFGQDSDLHVLPGQAPEPESAAPSPPAEGCTRPLWEGKDYKSAKAAVLEDFERGYLRDLLKRHRNNVSAAAREAGIHRNILHRMLARYRK